MQYSVTFPGGTTRYLFNTPFSSLGDYVQPGQCIIITDSNVARHHGHLFSSYKGVITLPAGEEHKNFATMLQVVQQLLQYEAHRGTTIVAAGGGMVTDMAGFIASVYMRGVPFGYAPTTLLGMADAAIGGKNGLNIGQQKNLLGTISQPSFILFDQHFLDTLPAEEWSNGFAEVIKYACLFDTGLFNELLQHDITYYRNSHAATAALVARCVDWKNKIVLADEREAGSRKLLNFGHTAGHAFETVCHLPHGHAVALGMLVACNISASRGLPAEVVTQLRQLLQQYGLPITIRADVPELMRVLSMDKKRDDEGIDYILLQHTGKGVTEHLSFNEVQKALEHFINDSNS